MSSGNGVKILGCDERDSSQMNWVLDFKLGTFGSLSLFLVADLVKMWLSVTNVLSVCAIYVGSVPQDGKKMFIISENREL